MSSLEMFLKPNRHKKLNVFYAPVRDEPDAVWEFRHLGTVAEARIRRECVVNGVFDSERYLRRLVCESVVYPSLCDVKLLDSYGVMRDEDLLLRLVDTPGDYARLVRFVQSLCGMVDEAQEAQTAKK